MSQTHAPSTLSNDTPHPRTHGTVSLPNPAKSLRLVAQQRAGHRIAALLALLVAAVAACLIFVPWQQTVVGYGQVIIFDAMNRPQNIEAQIPGRIVEWRVQEGQSVQRGDIIAKIEDTDSKFLARNQNDLLTAQRNALLETQVRARQRTRRFEQQKGALSQSRGNALQTARQRVEQSRKRLVNARLSLVAADKAYDIAAKVAVQSAKEQAQQAKDAVVQAQQALAFAQQNLVTARLQRERVGDLYKEGLSSQRTDELAKNEYVKNQTEVERARKALEIAKRGANIRVLEQNRVDVELQRVQTQVEQARANVDIAERDVFAARFDLGKLDNDTAAALSGVAASVESARSDIAKTESDIQKQETERQNLVRRTEQQAVRAPRAGRIVRLMKVGAGETVKAGDVMAVIAPDTPDRAVEIMITDNDVPLVAEGRKVRVQFAGWPALQWVGWPSAAVGTFAGVVSVIDAVDDGTARYRLVVRPDWDRIRAGQESPWPPSVTLRAGAEATGWVMLDTVPLGFELWRQFNAFPPTVKSAPIGQKSGKGEGGAKKEDRDGEKNEPFIKVKSKK